MKYHEFNSKQQGYRLWVAGELKTTAEDFSRLGKSVYKYHWKLEAWNDAASVWEVVAQGNGWNYEAVLAAGRAYAEQVAYVAQCESDIQQLALPGLD